MFKTLLKYVALAALLVGFNSYAFNKTPFTEQAFKAAINSNQPFLIDVYATWCGTCAKQQKIIGQYFAENPDSKIKVLIVDFDKQKDWVTHFRAPRQSTLVLYKGEEKLWFSVAETDQDKIFAQLSSAEKVN